VMIAPGPGGHRELWAGTEGGGISMADLDARPMTWTTLTSTTQPALPDDTVYHAEADAEGRVYAFTNRGVARIVRHPTAEGIAGDLAVETFTTEDGLPANEFNGGTGTLDHNGRLWAGTVAGVTVLDPSSEVPEPAPRLRWAGRTERGSGSALVEGETLAWNDADLVVDTTLVALFRGAETRYRVELTDGAGKNVTSGAWRSDRHRELPSLRAFGTAEPYTLRAWAKDYGGAVRGPEVVRFEVRPAPWLTVWAFALYGAVGIAGVWGTVRIRLRAVERRNRELEVRVANRTRELGEKVDELAVSERAARAAQDEAMRANRAKTTFLSTMSHELRTPLNAILGFAQLLARDRGLSADSRESVDVVAKSGEHLLGLINDVLSITRIEAGRLILEETTFVLSDVVGAVEKMTRVRARSKRLSLQVDVDAGTHATVRGDEGKLRQILLNLVGNAVKFTREGGVAVRSKWVDGRATFEIEDTGPGIPPADLAGLFEPFVQTETGRQAKEGTGLGLFISRSYARLMGGDIHVESRFGQGTIFRVELPLARGDAVAPSAEAPRVVGMAPGQGPYRVLIVDDAHDNRRLLTRLLTQVGGFDVREAANGLEAVRLFGEHRPDVTWMDLRMDGMDGIAATAAIRERETAEGWPRSVILALSASAFERDRQWLVESGCDEFIPKPYRESTIFDALTRHLSIAFVREGQTKSEAGAASVAPERIDRLPARLRSRLREAARSGDLRGARAAVVEVARLDDELANGLRAMVDAFRLEEIEAMLGEHG
jgi:signal transduction histidine kinase/CheY-like chemotaxis protein